MKLKNLLLIALVAIVFCGCQSNYQPTSITVASYNLRNANGGDSINGNGWGQRYPVIAQIVQYHDFDIFGTQECFIHQLKDIKEALPGYDYIGVGRDDGKEKGEHSAIFYRTDKFDVIEKGDFWLSETPDVPSKGWDAVLPRICSWGHFKCKDTGFEFLFFNLHMDHIGKKARVESAFLVQDKMKELGKGKELPAILTGDFNVDQTHQSYDAFVSKGVLCDSYEKAGFRYAINGTFNDFDPNSFTESRIDHIFVSPSFQVKRYGVLTDTYRSIVGKGEKKQANDCPEEIDIKTYQARTPSDHFHCRKFSSFFGKSQCSGKVNTIAFIPHGDFFTSVRERRLRLLRTLGTAGFSLYQIQRKGHSLCKCSVDCVITVQLSFVRSMNHRYLDN